MQNIAWNYEYYSVTLIFIRYDNGLFGFTVNDGEKSRLQSEVSRLKNKLSEGETRSNVLQSRLKELQADLSTTRKKLETTQSNNKDLRQQVLSSSMYLSQGD